jgi:NitT/TauT family transport system substrate-binding protein
VLPDVDSAPIIIAQHNGYFEQEGVDIRIEKFTSAMERDSALQAGAIDGAVSDILAAAFFEQGGFGVRITSMTNGSYKLLAGTGANDIGALKGKSIAVSSNTIIEYATDRMLSEYGLAPDDVVKTAIPKIPLRLEMLKNGLVDAATLPEPLASSAVNSGAAVLDSTDRLGINPGVMLFSASAAEAKSGGIKAFYRAYNKAVEYLNTAPVSDYIDVLTDEAGFPEDVQGSIALPEYTPAALPSQDDFEDVISWLKQKGLIENEYGYDELVYPGFTERE